MIPVTKKYGCTSASSGFILCSGSFMSIFDIRSLASGTNL